MRIAQVSPLHESVPPKSYGGTERIVSYLTEELVRQGHEVTLFASGDSKTEARLVSPCEASLLEMKSENPIPHHVVALQMVQGEAMSHTRYHNSALASGSSGFTEPVQGF